MPTTKNGLWWMSHRLSTGTPPRIRLMCFPYAGGNASLFHSWAERLPSAIEVCAMQLPGRVSRIRESPYCDIASLVRDLAPVVRPLLDRPVALFGHSLGAIVAYELARRLERDALAPAHLFVSGRRAPHLPDTDPPMYNLGDVAFIEKLAELKATADEVLVHPEMLDLMLPTLRADFQMAETYQHEPGVPLSCPITAFGGTDDEERVEGRLEAWRQHTSGRFAYHVFPGDHFFIHHCEGELLSIVGAELSHAPSRATDVAGAHSKRS